MDPRKLYDARGRLKPIHLLDADTAAAVASFDVDEATTSRGLRSPQAQTTRTVRLHDKVAALDRAMRHLGLYERDNRQQAECIAIEVIEVAPRPRDIDAE
jgi:phage terminase small subunit